MAVVQRSKEIKSIVEQTLYFMCSANHRLSVLRWKKVLVNIIKEKISLAEPPLRNAKRFLFGEDFLSISFKQAELSQDLAKNLSNTSKPKHPYQENLTNRDRQRPRYTDTFTKSQSNRSKSYRPFHHHKGPSNQDSSYKMFRFNSSPYRCRSVEAPIKKYPLHGNSLQQTVPSPCNRLSNRKHLLPKETLGDFLRSVDLKDAHLPSMYTSPHKSTFPSNGETKHLPFKASHLGKIQLPKFPCVYDLWSFQNTCRCSSFCFWWLKGQRIPRRPWWIVHSSRSK